MAISRITETGCISLMCVCLLSNIHSEVYFDLFISCKTILPTHIILVLKHIKLGPMGGYN
jgi:hypothetical protein